jgi:diguanylate cyclase (GGDEF)-like protein
MSFRSRLTTFFLLIVLVPMVGVGVIVFRLISDSQGAKADARVSGLATAAQSVYMSNVAIARAEAVAIARSPQLLGGANLDRRLQAVLASAGLARIEITSSGRVIADVGNPTAVAPGSARVSALGRTFVVTVSELTAAEYAAGLTSSTVGVVVRSDGRTLYGSIRTARLARSGEQTLTVGHTSYRALTQALPGFGGSRVLVTVLSSLAATATSTDASRAVAIAFIAGFLLLAIAFAILSSRALEGQLGRFLQAARRLASGDFTSPVPVEGNDDFAKLGAEFNNMSRQLEQRLADLDRERERLRESISRTGKTFASNLDRPALLELALRASMDAVGAEAGRLSVRSSADEPLAESLRVGAVIRGEEQILAAERVALAGGDLGTASDGGLSAISAALAPISPNGPAEGVITVLRRGRPFDDAERDMLRSLATQASLALENVRLHFQVRRQAVTDELTGLANHGRFQELLEAEMEQVRRYHHPVGLIMLDIDNFKQVNDAYGHQQGDVVLREVAHVLRHNSRETDTPARYGGEELAVILPHTDLHGAYVIAERIRASIERVRVPRSDGKGSLAITASLGVAATTSGGKDELIAEADGALYAAKRTGKNRTARASMLAANTASGR